ncbi:MAG: pyridoxal-phosphate dependent enzyme, partial [Paraprevotella sp.]|nr:pyridoxal-phosphate dependent enzyme [Paraprevotella sp.]
MKKPQEEKIYHSLMELIGHTPLMKINNYMEATDCKDAIILAKLEYLNPAGSVKDRVALAMINDAEEKGI